MNHSMSSAHYDTHTIRQLLLAAFSDEELTIFCYDYFPNVYREFTMGMTFSAKVQLLIAECASRNFFDTLLDLVQKNNPHQYAAFAPALQAATSTLSNVPAKLSTKAIPIVEKKRAVILKPKWSIGCLMLAIVLLLSSTTHIFFSGLVAPQPAEPLSLLFEPTSQLVPQPAPEPLRLSTLAGTIEPTLSDFIEPIFEPTHEATTEPMPETIEESWLAQTSELPVEISITYLSEPQLESITDQAAGWDEGNAEAWVEPTAEPTEEPSEEPALEPTEEPTPEPIEEPGLGPTLEPMTEFIFQPTAEPTEEPNVESPFEPMTEFIFQPIAEPTEEPTEAPTPELTQEIAER